MRTALAILVVLTVTGCGSDSPTAPTPPPPPPPVSIAGNWSGTFESSDGIEPMLMNLTQAGGTVNGTYTTARLEGTVTGTVDASTFSGSTTVTGRSTTGGVCTGNASLSGAVTTASFTWTSPGFTGTCTGMPINVRIVVQRR